MERRDWLLLTLSVTDGTPLTPVQLQKSLFLLGQNLRDGLGEDYYEFRPYNYGPFCVDIYSDATDLAHEGLVEISRPPGRSWVEYGATPAGLDTARSVKNFVTDHVLEYISTVVTWTRSLTFPQLVSAIYESYPEQRANSVFR